MGASTRTERVALKVEGAVQLRRAGRISFWHADSLSTKSLFAVIFPSCLVLFDSRLNQLPYERDRKFFVQREADSSVGSLISC